MITQFDPCSLRGPASSRRAPSDSRRDASPSTSGVSMSRCIRFLAALASGTAWSRSLGLDAVGVDEHHVVAGAAEGGVAERFGPELGELGGVGAVEDQSDRCGHVVPPCGCVDVLGVIVARRPEVCFEHGTHRQPGMSAMRVELVVGFPCRDLDEGAQRVGAATPVEPGGVDGSTGSVFVGVQEPVGESCADRPGRRPDRCGSAEGRVGEHQRGEREVVVGVGDDGGGPVDQRPPVAVDEQVERVEIAVADDPRVVRGGGEVFGVRARSCRPMASACAARRSRKSWMSGWRVWPASAPCSPSSGQWWSVAAASARRSGSRRSRVGACLIAVDALSPASSGCPVAKSITLQARSRSLLGPSAQRMAGTGNPYRVRWR